MIHNHNQKYNKVIILLVINNLIRFTMLFYMLNYMKSGNINVRPIKSPVISL